MTSTPSGIAESSDGSIWLLACNNGTCSNLKFDGSAWSQAPFVASDPIGYAAKFDSDDNYWYSGRMNGPTLVRWGGLDYAFTDGQWLSPTCFQAGYTFDANILPGFYTMQVDGAVGSDGITAYGGVSNTFRVDFGAGVTLDPPLPPQVAAQSSSSLNHLAASWQSSSPNIDQYRYAIGTTPGARNVVGWTYLAGTSVTRSNLNLVQGQTYYVTVQARNTSGLWSVNGVSNGVIGGETRVYLPVVNRP